jgi:hypothetical protein
MYSPNPKVPMLHGDVERRQQEIATEAKFQQDFYTDGRRPRRRTFYQAWINYHTSSLFVHTFRMNYIHLCRPLNLSHAVIGRLF